MKGKIPPGMCTANRCDGHGKIGRLQRQVRRALEKRKKEGGSRQFRWMTELALRLGRRNRGGGGDESWCVAAKKKTVGQLNSGGERKKKKI